MHIIITKKIKHALLITPEAIKKVCEILINNEYNSLSFIAYCNHEIQFRSTMDEFLAFDNYDDSRISSFSIEGSKGEYESVYLGIGEGAFDSIWSTATLKISTSDEKTGIYLREQILRVVKDCKPNYSIATRVPVFAIVGLPLIFYYINSYINKISVACQPTFPIPRGWSVPGIMIVLFLALIIMTAFCQVVLEGFRRWVFPKVSLLIGKQAYSHSNMTAWRLGVGGSIIASAIIFLLWEIVGAISRVGR